MSTQSFPQETAARPLFGLGSITDKVSSTILDETPWWWWVGFIISGIFALAFVAVLGAVAIGGVGLWGINMPVVWGMGIVNLIFWIGIGHAGTFISAFLLLMRQHWRGAFSRFAEAMTLFALATAGMFPLFHVGRPEYIYWFAPYPNTFILNPQWRSPLVWDAIAISTYGIVSAIFWYLDLLPDLAAMRDKTDNELLKVFYSVVSMGWRGEARHWDQLHKTAFLLAALATPLVISVHSVVGLDFAISNVPGWHHTIFPPYFVAGAVFSGLAMVLIVAIALRKGWGLEDLITEEAIDKGAKLMLVTGLLVAYGYFAETFGAFYKNDIHEVLLVVGRAVGPYAPFYWGMIFFNVIAIQVLWIKRLRKNMTMLFIVCIGVLVGMWLERFVIVSISLSYSYLTEVWALFKFNLFDVLTIFAPFGFFFFQFFLFIRFFPVLPIAELQQEAVAEAVE